MEAEMMLDGLRFLTGEQAKKQIEMLEDLVPEENKCSSCGMTQKREKCGFCEVDEDDNSGEKDTYASDQYEHNRDAFNEL